MAIKNHRTILFYSILVIILFLLDRFSKLYILNLAETESEVDIYVTSFLNFYLTWNSGIGFGLFSFDKSIIYKFITYFNIEMSNNLLTVLCLFFSVSFGCFFYSLIDKIFKITTQERLQSYCV